MLILVTSVRPKEKEMSLMNTTYSQIVMRLVICNDIRLCHEKLKYSNKKSNKQLNINKDIKITHILFNLFLTRTLISN